MQVNTMSMDLNLNLAMHFQIQKLASMPTIVGKLSDLTFYSLELSHFDEEPS